MLTVGTIGSLLAGLSIFFSALIVNFSGLIIVFGFICGLGFSFMIVPAVVSVNLYFNHFRPFANGMSSAGSGLGYILMPMSLKFLLNIMSWRNALKVTAGIFSSAVLASLFLWPFSEEVKVVEEDEKKNMMEVEPKSTDLPTKSTLAVPEEKLTSKNFYSMPSIVQSISGHRDHFSSHSNVNAVSSTHIVRPLSRKDIFYSGVVHTSQIDELNIEVAIVDRQGHNHAYESTAISDDSRKSCLKDLMKVFDFALFIKIDFVLIVIMSAFTQFAYFIPFVYLNDYASQKRGIPEKPIMLMLVALGVGNTLGRISGGLLANIKRINPELLNMISLILCAASSLCVPFFKSVSLLLTYSAVQGFALAVTTTIQPILLIRATALFRFTAGVGNLNLVKGIASIIGTPIAGALVDATGDYDAVFFWAGGCFLVAIPPLITLFILNRRKRGKSSSDSLTSSVAI